MVDTTTLLLGGEPTTRNITIEQGDRRFQVVPLSNNQTIEDFYGYRGFSFNAPIENITASDESRLFFWEGPRGLSLVFVHDAKDDGSGGAVSFEYSGLSNDTEGWVVKDGPGDTYNLSAAHWNWYTQNTDGGAIRGGLSGTEITLQPRFNDEARKDPQQPGRIEKWQVLTGQATDPRTIELSMNQSITIDIAETPDRDGPNIPEEDAGTAKWTYDLSRSDQLTIEYQTEQTDENPNATLSVTDENGTTVTENLTIGTSETINETIDLTELSGARATIEVSADDVNMSAEFIPGAHGGASEQAAVKSPALERPALWRSTAERSTAEVRAQELSTREAHG